MTADPGDTDEFLFDEDRFRYSPMAVFPEIFVDLDLQWLTASDDVQRWAALVAGTREVIDRLRYLASPKIVGGPGPACVIDDLRRSVDAFVRDGAQDYGAWLQSVVEVLEAHAHLHDGYVEEITAAGTDKEAAELIVEAAASLNAAAAAMSEYQFAPYPPCPQYAPADMRRCLLAGNAGTCLAAETHRMPLRVQLDGVGGMAGSAELNPYTAALFALELATHRRLYRLFYNLCVHVGLGLERDDLYLTPGQVDQLPLNEPRLPPR